MKEWDEDEMSPDELENDENLNVEPIDESTATPSEKYEKLLGEDSKKYKLSGMFKDWFLDYSSYVILQRAVPNIVDGLKPVQRRVLHAMFKMDDGNMTKVANIVGQAMQYHPHGDASILGALVQLGQKGFALDCQGNWGNILTGDSNAAARYIEARLSKFAKEVIFDPKITNWMTSYDGRNQEPTELPVRFPLLLAQGTEGIAVGMASKILPHNFNELIDASIAYLQGKPFELLPDFPTGGLADCSKYMKGQRGGSVKIRAKIEKIDKNTLAIKEIPYGKTTHALVDSILKAKDKGKIKIKKIEDMTTSTADLVIHLPNDVSPDKTIDALYAFTDCETTVAPNACVIKDNKPQFLSVEDILIYDTEHTKELLGRQLEIRKGELEDNWHYTSLEKIFFENRVYKLLEEDQKSWEDQVNAILARMKEFQSQLVREIKMEDILKLVEKPVRKISKFDTKVIDEKILEIEKELNVIKEHLANLTQYTVDFFRNIKSKYGKDFPRRTEITGFETITATKVVSNNAKLYANMEEGFVGMGLKKNEGDFICDCSDMSEIIVISKDGRYWIKKVTEKDYFGKNLLYVGIYNRSDSRTIYNVIYRDGKAAGKNAVYYAKRFAITSITRDKEYNITQGTPGSEIMWFSVNHNGEAETVKIYFKPKPKLKKLNMEYDFSELAIKGKLSRGNLVTKNAIQRISLKSKGISTIGGKDIWFDTDVNRLNEEGRGDHLGQFSGDDKILAIFKDGTWCTTSYDMSNRYQGDLLRIEKYDENKIYAALYFDGPSKQFYIKRFSFPVNDNAPASFIPEGKGTYLADFSADKHPQFMVTFTGRQEHREPEKFDAEEFIAKKGITAKGNRCHRYDVLKVEFIEPLEKPEEDEDEGVKPGEVITLGPEDIPEGESFNPEAMYRPAEEGEEPLGDIGEPDPDNEDDEPNLFDM